MRGSTVIILTFTSSNGSNTANTHLYPFSAELGSVKSRGQSDITGHLQGYFNAFYEFGLGVVVTMFDTPKHLPLYLRIFPGKICSRADGQFEK